MNFLDNETLKNGLINLQKEMLTKEEDAFEYWAEEMVKLFKAYIKSGKVTIEKGILVSTSSGSGATTSIGTGKII